MSITVPGREHEVFVAAVGRGLVADDDVAERIGCHFNPTDDVVIGHIGIDSIKGTSDVKALLVARSGAPIDHATLTDLKALAVLRRHAVAGQTIGPEEQAGAIVLET